ncbi:hypothetical protein AFM11_03010 [Mycolicibacterium wolinskyi]|uniref:Uncharacterized protein n=1 Tax=Mycolicibacterium wolinskyi TaxID=59750 RepID=A0A132PSF4_9MYCO|nr:hypothetical protein AFM11_03010 [Mycolicibacterium wolinskyi]
MQDAADKKFEQFTVIIGTATTHVPSDGFGQYCRPIEGRAAVRGRDVGEVLAGCMGRAAGGGCCC